MKLLYDRVLIRKVIQEEWAEGIIKHYLSEEKRTADVSEGVVVYVGNKCETLEPGMRVAYPTKLERKLFLGEESLIEMRENLILGILEENCKLG